GRSENGCLPQRTEWAESPGIDRCIGAGESKRGCRERRRGRGKERVVEYRAVVWSSWRNCFHLAPEIVDLRDHSLVGDAQKDRLAWLVIAVRNPNHLVEDDLLVAVRRTGRLYAELDELRCACADSFVWKLDERPDQIGG